MQDEEQLEKELRLFYVALTRAKTWLYVLFPVRSFFASAGQFGGGFGMAQLTRFISEQVQRRFGVAGAVEPIGLTRAEHRDKVASVRQRLKRCGTDEAVEGPKRSCEVINRPQLFRALV